MHFIPAASMHFPFPTMFIFFFFSFLGPLLPYIPLSVTSIERLDHPSFWLQLPPCTTVWSCAHRETMCKLTVYVRLT